MITDVEIEFTPHAGQWEVIRSEARFRVVACGRRWGKTMLSGALILKHATENPRSLCMWVAPVYSQTDIAFRMLVNHLPPDVAAVNRSEKTIQLSNGSRIVCKSADQPQNLRGFGVNFMVVDEAGYIKQDAWTGALRPTLSDTGGKALLIGTFQGENWFYDMYERGQDPEHPEWESWRYMTIDNPFIPQSEVDEARATLPREVFDQEFESSPLSYKGSVFNGVLVQQSTERGRDIHVEAEFPKYAGLDWGYNTTAFEVCQEHPDDQVSWIDEHVWHGEELVVRCQAIARLCEMYDIQEISADAAGATEIRTLHEVLKSFGRKTSIQPIPFGKYKDRGIQVRRYYMERGLESMTPQCRELIHDTKRYHYKEGTEDIAKESDHSVDAATCFYATRKIGRVK